jgi:hypothetical protein
MQSTPVDSKKTRNNAGCIALFVLVTILSFASAIIFRVPVVKTADASDACWMAQEFVSEELKAPSTAKFAPCREPETVVTQINRLWRVNSWVDAENGFGATLRNRYTADLIYYPSTDTWTLRDLSLR